MDFTEFGRPGISVITLWDDGDEERREGEAIKVDALKATMSIHWTPCLLSNGLGVTDPMDKRRSVPANPIEIALALAPNIDIQSVPLMAIPHSTTTRIHTSVTCYFCPSGTHANMHCGIVHETRCTAVHLCSTPKLS
ncbi:hypothetical protein VE02_05147 [Pseudogymnoascus sp. 03VT05]|nr:hypothetical protein VE02_05147 [Pseudogymnoascus sp. 03VT05]